MSGPVKNRDHLPEPGHRLVRDLPQRRRRLLLLRAAVLLPPGGERRDEQLEAAEPRGGGLLERELLRLHGRAAAAARAEAHEVHGHGSPETEARAHAAAAVAGGGRGGGGGGEGEIVRWERGWGLGVGEMGFIGGNGGEGGRKKKRSWIDAREVNEVVYLFLSFFMFKTLRKMGISFWHVLINVRIFFSLLDKNWEHCNREDNWVTYVVAKYAF